MLVFIREIPESVSRQDLRHFVSEGLRSPWRRLLGHNGEIRALEILRILDEEAGTIEFHGLVDIESAKDAQRVIRRLNGRRLLGRNVEVRQYHVRSPQRDRRGQPHAEGELLVPDRRVRDRRRSHLRRERVHVSAPEEGGAAWPPSGNNQEMAGI